MTKENYLKMIQWSKSSVRRQQLLCGINRFFPILLAIVYIFTLIACFLVYPVFLLRLIFRPLLCFVCVTVLRILINEARPYDQYNFIPLCGYHPGKNKSFPSRHTASAFIIAFEIGHIWYVFGMFACLLALAVGISRILCGNHFIKDVLAAFGIALFFCFL